MLGFLLPSLFTCPHTHTTGLIRATTTPSSFSRTNSSTLPPPPPPPHSKMEGPATPSRRRPSKWMYRTLLLSIAEWAREPSSPAVLHVQCSAKEGLQADTMEKQALHTEDNKTVGSYQEHAEANSAEKAEAGYTHARSLEEGQGSHATWCQRVTKKSRTETRGVRIDGEEEERGKEIGGDVDDDADLQYHPNLRTQWKWTIVAK